MRIEIGSAEMAFGGRSFDSVGTYQKIVGRAVIEVDPAHRLNREIVNLDKAPKNDAGRVEYAVDFCLLKPTDLSKSNRRIFYEVPNRGMKFALIDFNDAKRGPTTEDPTIPADAGNGFLMRRGYVILFSAWQGNVPPGARLMVANLPVASNNGDPDDPIVGLSREEVIFGHIDSPAIAPLTYPATTLDQDRATLTVRQHEPNARVQVSAQHWRYLSPTQIEIDLLDGFDAGAIYEFIYPARDPIVMGLGFAAVRDLVAFMRYAEHDDTGQPNPLALNARPAIDHVIAYGRSQSGRFLRDFVRLGFNEERGGRKVFDGVFASLAGARGIFLNHPFAQPGRFQRQHEDRLYPGDQFPFTYATRTDPISGKTDGILARALASNTCPKIIHTDSSSEFWVGRSSLIVADENGRDIPLPDEVRTYLFTGTGHAGPTVLQHDVVFLGQPSACESQRSREQFGTLVAIHPSAYPMNMLDFNPLNRSFLVVLDEWATKGIAPPPSRFPLSGDGTLVAPLPQSDYGFPEIPGVTYTGIVNKLSEMDYSEQPPKPIPGREYGILVPKVDADGNEVAGIRLPDVSAPRGTYTGWNTRGEGFSEGALMLIGSYFPFASTAEERRAKGDPRPSLEERYPSYEHYIECVKRAAAELQADRLLLAEDAERYVAPAAAASWAKS